MSQNQTLQVVAVSATNPGYTLESICGVFGSSPCTWSAGGTFTLVGDGTAGYNGDGIAATTAEINGPWGVGIDPHGNLVFSDNTNAYVRVVAVSAINPGYTLGNDCGGGSSACSWTVGDIYNIAGSGSPGNNADEDGHAAAEANIDQPEGLTVDAQGNPIFADSANNLVEVIADLCDQSRLRAERELRWWRRSLHMGHR